MTFQSKRAWRLQEFAAHGGNVNCLALGPKKARLMATGGEDRKVSFGSVVASTFVIQFINSVNLLISNKVCSYSSLNTCVKNSPLEFFS